jgi:tetratricopeptide (TPR) repeat protein/DNA-binding CsgD family transcriptional regulator
MKGIKLLLLIILVAPGCLVYPQGNREQENMLPEKSLTRVDVLLRESDSLRKLNQLEAFQKAELALQFSRRMGDNPILEGRVLNNYLVCCIQFFYLNRAEEQLPQLDILLPRLGDSSQLALNALAGRASLLSGRYSKADQYLGEAIRKAVSLSEEREEAMLRSLLADSYRYQGRYPEAMESRTMALQYFDATGDSTMVAESRVGIGIIELMTGKFSEAKTQFKASLAYFTAHRDSVGMGLAETALSLAYFRQDSLDQALEHAWTSFKIREGLGDIRGMGESLNNLALMYMKRGMWGLARDYLEASLENREKGQDLRQIPVMLANLGLCNRKLGNYELAEGLYKEAIARAKASGADHDLSQAYEGYQLLEEDRGNYREAYRYALMHAQLEDSLFGIEKERELRRISESYEQKKAAIENERLRLELKSRQRERIGLIAIGLLLALVAVLIWNRQRMRIRQAQLAHDKERGKLEERMNSYMKRVLEKNALVEKLENQLATIEVKDNDAEAKRAARLTELRQMKILTEEDWRTFRQHFESVYRGFLDRLVDQYPDLTKGERRMFVLVKLNLSTSEIADILGISSDSVKKARYRLRKKLQLPDDQPLNDFIQAF